MDRNQRESQKVHKLLKIAFSALLIVLAANFLNTIAYGHTSNGATLDGTVESDIQVEAAPLTAAPSAIFYGNAIGSINPGDLFYIESANVTQDIVATLYLTNVDTLIHKFKYMNLKVGVYYEVAEGQWERALNRDGSIFPDILLTMKNGLVTLSLPGRARYKVTLDGGCYNSHPYYANSDNSAPQFYLEVEAG